MTKALQGDIPVGDWIDRYMPAMARPYFRLMRIDRPIGTWLLLFPCWWSVALATDGWPSLYFFALMAVGAVIMRGAGCVVNDICDRDFDRKVARTATRPLASGALSVKQAALFLGFMLLLGLVVLVQFNTFTILVGVASLALVFPYPLMKRITYWPQAWLGLTFNWGALMGWTAVQGTLDVAPVVLYLTGVVWTLGYDTIYAHQDKEDDVLVGVKSTALRFGAATKQWVSGFYVLTILGIGLAGYLVGLSWPFYVALVAGALQLGWQVMTGNLDDMLDCLSKFKSNRYFGWIILTGIVAGQLV